MEKNNDASNRPFLEDGDTTIRKKDPDNSPDWRESDMENPSRVTGWQASNERDNTIREPEGTFTTGERGNVINSATWDPENHTKEEDVEHVDAKALTEKNKIQNKTPEQRIKLQEEEMDAETEKTQKGYI